MTQSRKRGAEQIPTFKDEAEAAAFWDTHSPEDYPEEFVEAEVRFSRPLIKRGLTIKLSEDTIRDLREIAQQKGIGPSTLVRMWVLEHLREVRRPAATPHQDRGNGQ
jgi:CopG antitoxin of type II toxin-antitoxin system